MNLMTTNGLNMWGWGVRAGHVGWVSDNSLHMGDGLLTMDSTWCGLMFNEVLAYGVDDR